MCFILLRREGTPELRLDAQREKYACCQSGAGNLLGRSSAGELISGTAKAAHGTESAAGPRVTEDVARGDGSPDPIADVVTQDHEPTRIGERKRTEQNSFNQRKHSCCGADAQGHRHNDREGKSRRLSQLANCVANTLHHAAHPSSRSSDNALWTFGEIRTALPPGSHFEIVVRTGVCVHPFLHRKRD